LTMILVDRVPVFAFMLTISRREGMAGDCLAWAKHSVVAVIRQ